MADLTLQFSEVDASFDPKAWVNQAVERCARASGWTRKP